MTESKNGSAGGEMPKPTANEAMFFFAIVKYTKNKADIDWDGVATEQGFKNAEVAKVRFGQVKRKLGINSDAPTPGSGTGPVTPKKTTPNKVKKTPASRTGTKGGKRGGKVKKEEEVEAKNDSEDENNNHHQQSATLSQENVGLIGNAKEERLQSIFASPVKREKQVEADAEAQLQAEMDALINPDPF